MPNYTTEDLLLYMYRETSPDNSASIERALATDWALREKFEVLKQFVEVLDTAVESPRQQSVTAILNYARASAEVVE